MTPPEVEQVEQVQQVEEPVLSDPTINENYDSLRSMVEAMNEDLKKFNIKKVKASGSRVRNNLLNCRKLCDKIRKQILADMKSIPVKRRAKEITVVPETSGSGQESLLVV